MAICRFNFGSFEINEFKKFLHMGGIFALIIGVYWALRPLKDSIFIQLVDALYLPYAKTISLLVLLPLVIFYTKLLDKFPKEKMLVLLPGFYGVTVLIFSVLMYFAQGTPEAIANRSFFLLMGTQFLGYTWYLFVESFGSLAVALFWAFSADTTDHNSAKKGFPLVVAIGQLGGIFFPYTIAGLPHRLGLSTDTLSIVIVGLLTLLIIPFFKYFIKKTPSSLLASFEGVNQKRLEKNHDSGFFSGLKLLMAHKYLLGIFTVNFIYEVIITIFDFNFKLAAATQYKGVALTNYLSIYGSSVNIISLFFLLFGISNISRFLGIRVALTTVPVIVGLALFSFLTIDSLTFLFCLMVGSKAINYALNGPALKQLYIPTSSDARFKAQAWIETFGARASKEAGSIFNMGLKPLQSTFGELAGKSYYLGLSGLIGFPLLILWFITAIYLNKLYQKAIKDQKLVC